MAAVAGSAVATATLLGTFQSIARNVLASVNANASDTIDIQIPHLLGGCPDKMYPILRSQITPVLTASLQPAPVPNLVSWNASVANYKLTAAAALASASNFDFVNEIVHSIAR